MKVTLLTDSDVFAGTERHILDLAIALRAEGIEAEVACPAQGVLAERARQAGLPFFAVEKGFGLDLAAIFRLRHHLRERQTDVIHAHNGRTTFIAAVAVALAGRGVMVATQHFTSPTRTSRRGWKGWLSRKLHGWVAQRTDHTIAISDAVRRGLLERGDVLPGKLTMVWNGIADPMEQTLRPPAEVRVSLEVPPDALLIVCAARLHPEKAVHVLIDAVAHLHPKYPKIHCLVAGEGQEETPLKKRIDRLGTGAVIRLIGYQPDVLSIVQAADIFVLPSLDEPFGLALVEAMALSRPVIATRAGGPLEIVSEGESGLLVPPLDAAQLCLAMDRVLGDQIFAAAMGRSARQRFLSHFNVRRMAREIAAIYAQTIKGRI